MTLECGLASLSMLMLVCVSEFDWWKLHYRRWCDGRQSVRYILDQSQWSKKQRRTELINYHHSIRGCRERKKGKCAMQSVQAIAKQDRFFGVRLTNCARSIGTLLLSCRLLLLSATLWCVKGIFGKPIRCGRTAATLAATSRRLISCAHLVNCKMRARDWNYGCDAMSTRADQTLASQLAKLCQTTSKNAQCCRKERKKKEHSSSGTWERNSATSHVQEGHCSLANGNTQPVLYLLMHHHHLKSCFENTHWKMLLLLLLR